MRADVAAAMLGSSEAASGMLRFEVSQAPALTAAAGVGGCLMIRPRVDEIEREEADMV